MSACVDLLGRHPAECDLPPRALAELIALKELREEKLCPKCLTDVRRAMLKRKCLRCGDDFNDPEIAALLERG